MEIQKLIPVRREEIPDTLPPSPPTLDRVVASAWHITSQLDAAGVEPGALYRVTDLAPCAGSEDLGLVRAALLWSGWEELDGLLRCPTPERIDTIDNYVMSRLRALDRGAGVRAHAITGQSRGLVAWNVHGALARLEARGPAYRAPEPEPADGHRRLGRRPAPRWHVTPHPASADTTPVTSVV